MARATPTIHLTLSFDYSMGYHELFSRALYSIAVTTYQVPLPFFIFALILCNFGSRRVVIHSLPFMRIYIVLNTFPSVFT